MLAGPITAAWVQEDYKDILNNLQDGRPGAAEAGVSKRVTEMEV